jgi:peptide deformylase
MDKYYLRTWDDPILSQICQPIKDFSKLDDLISSMKHIMLSKRGVGIAAPQVGYSGQILLAKINHRPKVFINPKIIGAKEDVSYRESCLSFPGLSKCVSRNYSIDLTYQNESGHTKEETYTGLNAIIIQHEIDHLYGITIHNLD